MNSKKIGDTESVSKVSLRKALSITVYKCRLAVIMYLTTILVIYGVCFLYHQGTEPFFYAFLLIGIALLAVIATTYYREYQSCKQRERILRSIETAWDSLPEGENAKEADYLEMIQKLGRQADHAANEMRRNGQEMTDYYTVWVHQIKTPIAVMNLLVKGEDSDFSRKMSAELFRVEQYAEMALNYSRLGSGVNDLMLQEYELDDLIRESIRKYAPQFIYRKLRIVYDEIPGKIVTDKKWFMTIFEQLLSNAIKYTAQGSVTIGQAETGELFVRDTGIGISPEDIPRIFERGFTGANGRMGGNMQKATGIGLYLCKMAADKLSLIIRAESVVGEGTTFYIHFPNEKEEQKRD